MFMHQHGAAEDAGSKDRWWEQKGGRLLADAWPAGSGSPPLPSSSGNIRSGVGSGNGPPGLALPSEPLQQGDHPLQRLQALISSTNAQQQQQQQQRSAAKASASPLFQVYSASNASSAPALAGLAPAGRASATKLDEQRTSPPGSDSMMGPEAQLLDLMLQQQCTLQQATPNSPAVAMSAEQRMMVAQLLGGLPNDNALATDMRAASLPGPLGPYGGDGAPPFSPSMLGTPGTPYPQSLLSSDPGGDSLEMGMRMGGVPPSPSAILEAAIAGAATSASLYVKNLPPDTDELLLYQKFAPHGALLSCKVQTDPVTGKCRGVGFVNYVDQAAALRAMHQLHGTRISEGRALHISLQAPRAVRAAAAAAATATKPGLSSLGSSPGMFSSPAPSPAATHTSSLMGTPMSTLGNTSSLMGTPMSAAGNASSLIGTPMGGAGNISSGAPSSEHASPSNVMRANGTAAMSGMGGAGLGCWTGATGGITSGQQAAGNDIRT